MALGDIGLAGLALVFNILVFGMLSVPVAWVLSNGLGIVSQAVPVFEFTRQTGDILAWLWVGGFVLVGIVFWGLAFINQGKNRSQDGDY
jgi:hypothetical protein